LERARAGTPVLSAEPPARIAPRGGHIVAARPQAEAQDGYLGLYHANSNGAGITRLTFAWLLNAVSMLWGFKPLEGVVRL
jgi:hypothetical protein